MTFKIGGQWYFSDIFSSDAVMGRISPSLVEQIGRLSSNGKWFEAKNPEELGIWSFADFEKHMPKSSG